MSAATHGEIVLSHLKTTGPLTALEALKDYNILCLAERIRDLRAEGHEILSEKVKGHRYVRYVLVKPSV